MSKDTLGLKPNEIKQAIFRLAHFNPTCKDEYGNQVIDYLVLDALANFGQLLAVTASEIKDYIKKSFFLGFEEAEINSSGNRLSQKRMINYITEKKGEKLEKPTFQVFPEIEEKITTNLTQIQELENIVIQEWKEEIINKYKDYHIVKDNIEPIVKNMKSFTSKMFIRHGVDCVALLYPEEGKTHEWLAEVSSMILEDLHKIDVFVDAIVKVEIPIFFKHHDSKRKKYITSLFNSSFFWHLIQVDEKCSQLLRETTKGQCLYLDNNILYSLVGLHGANMLQSIHSMLKMAKELGYELRVTTKTIDEFNNSLNWQLKEFKIKPPLPTDLARIALENLEDESFLTAYWKDFVKNGVSIEEFVAEKKHIQDILRGMKIITTNKFREEIEDSPQLKDEESILRSVCTYDVGDHVIEHDAFHRILINKLRKVPKHHFFDAVAWFLTQDSKLPTYDRVARKGVDSLPFCIIIDQWVQINRPLLERTSNQEEYEASFNVLVTQPFLRTMIPTISLDKAYNEVLGRLARYKKMNPKLALGIVTDKHFMISISSETPEESIEDKVENKFIDLATQLQSDKDKLKEEVETKEETAQSLQERVSNLESTVEADKAKYNEQIEQQNNKIEELNKTIVQNRKKHQEEIDNYNENIELDKAKYQLKLDELNNILEEEKRKKEIADNDLIEFKVKVKKWAIFTISIVLVSLLLWLYQYWVDWPWLNTHKNKIFIMISSQILILSLLINIPLKQHWKTWMKVTIPSIFAILGFACL